MVNIIQTNIQLKNLSVFDFNEMSDQQWKNLCQCFFLHPVKKYQRKQKKTRKCNVESIIVCGGDNCNEHGEKPNNANESGDLIISSPMKLNE